MDFSDLLPGQTCDSARVVLSAASDNIDGTTQKWAYGGGWALPTRSWHADYDTRMDRSQWQKPVCIAAWGWRLALDIDM